MVKIDSLESILKEYRITIDTCEAGILGQSKPINYQDLPKYIKETKTQETYQLRIKGTVKFDGIEERKKVEVAYIGGLVRAKAEGVHRPAIITEEFYIECIKKNNKSEAQINIAKNARQYLTPLIDLLNRTFVPSPRFNYR